jgi:hypothetical protein
MPVRRPLKTEGRRIFKRDVSVSDIREVMLSGALPLDKPPVSEQHLTKGIAEIPAEGATP